MRILQYLLVLSALAFLAWRMLLPILVPGFSFIIIAVGGYLIFKMVYSIFGFIIAVLRRIDNWFL